MKIINIILIGIVYFAVTGCTPAKLVDTPPTNDDNKAEVKVYRKNTINQTAVTAVVGADGHDYVTVQSGNFSVMTLPAGVYEFFVRSDQGDRPYKMQAQISKNEPLCLFVAPKASDGFKALIPIIYWTTSAFTMEKITCPTEQQETSPSSQG